MKNKGFTLIELLAVIVILSIIALIAVPIILNIINSSKESSDKRSKELYLSAVEQAIARKNLTGEYNPTECTLNKDGDLDCKNEKGELLEPLTVETTGAKPNVGGTITLQNGKVTENTLVFGGGNTEVASKICTLVSGTSQTVGAKYTCTLDEERTFYVLENNASSDTITLIMDRNFTDGDGTNGTIPPTVAWCTDGGDDNTTCKNINTTGSDAPAGKDYIGHITEVFNTEGVTVSFPTKEQIESAYTGDMPEWLYDYINGTTNSEDLFGYWTASPIDDNSGAWIVDCNGSVGSDAVASDNYSGLRPVITVSKSDLS